MTFLRSQDGAEQNGASPLIALPPPPEGLEPCLPAVQSGDSPRHFPGACSKGGWQVTPVFPSCSTARAYSGLLISGGSQVSASAAWGHFCGERQVLHGWVLEAQAVSQSLCPLLCLVAFLPLTCSALGSPCCFPLGKGKTPGKGPRVSLSLFLL